MRPLHTPLAAVLVVLAGLAAGPLVSCSSGGKTAEGTTYDMTATRALETTLGASLDEVYEASRAAMDDLGFEIDERRKDRFEGLITAETATGDEVEVSLTRVAENSTRV